MLPEPSNPSWLVPYNMYKVLHIMYWVSEFVTAITYLSGSLFILSALSTLFGRHVRYIRLQHYYYNLFNQTKCIIDVRARIWVKNL